MSMFFSFETINLTFMVLLSYALYFSLTAVKLMT